MKDFDKWNEDKKKINSSKGRYYHERDIWWCALGLNIGSEQDGRGELFQRPVLVVKGLSSHSCVVIPLTTSDEKHKLRVSLGKIGGKDAKAILSQIKVVDTKRFTERLSILEKEKFVEIQKNIKRLF